MHNHFEEEGKRLKSLSDEILNLIEDSDLSYKEVASMAGVSARSIYEIKIVEL